MTDQPRQPPHNIEAEQCILGSLLLDPNSFDRIELLDAGHFYREDHRLIYVALRNLIQRGGGVDILILADALTKAGELERAGGLPYIGALAQNTPSAYNIGHYAGIVRDKAILRSLASKAIEIADKAMSPHGSAQELAEEAEKAFFSVLDREDSSDSISMLQAADEALEWAANQQQGLSTGYLGLDAIIGGLREEELIVIAGRPGMGKSALSQCIAESVSRDTATLFCSLEMSKRQIGKRSMAYHEANLGTAAAMAHLASMKMRVDARSPLTLGLLRLRIRRQIRRYGLGLLVVDYLQQIKGPKSENRNQEVGAISRGLKSIAKEFHIPVIAVASLNRQTEGRQDRRPLMSDLKESGDIESDADIVIMVYRDKEYSPISEWGDIAEVIVRKHREGRIGTAYMTWNGETTRFSDYAGPLPIVREVKRSTKKAVDFKRRTDGDDS